MRTFGEYLIEAAAPGQEDWILKNKAGFIKQYGKERGLQILYATAWKRLKSESVSGAAIAELAYNHKRTFEAPDSHQSVMGVKL